MLNSTRRSSRNWIVWRAISSSPSVFSHWIPPHGRLKPVSLLLILDRHLGMSNGFSTPFTFSGDLVRTIYAALHKKPASDGGNLSSGRPTSGPCGPDEQRSRHTTQSGEAAHRDHTGIGGHSSATRGPNRSGRTAPRRPAHGCDGAPGDRCRPATSSRLNIAIHVSRYDLGSPHGDRRPCDLRRAGDKSPRRSARAHQPLRTRQDQLRIRRSGTRILHVVILQASSLPDLAL